MVQNKVNNKTFETPLIILLANVYVIPIILLCLLLTSCSSDYIENCKNDCNDRCNQISGCIDKLGCEEICSV